MVRPPSGRKEQNGEEAWFPGTEVPGNIRLPAGQSVPGFATKPWRIVALIGASARHVRSRGGAWNVGSMTRPTSSRHRASCDRSNCGSKRTFMTLLRKFERAFSIRAEAARNDARYCGRLVSTKSTEIAAAGPGSRARLGRLLAPHTVFPRNTYENALIGAAPVRKGGLRRANPLHHPWSLAKRAGGALIHGH